MNIKNHLVAQCMGVLQEHTRLLQTKDRSGSKRVEGCK